MISVGVPFPTSGKALPTSAKWALMGLFPRPFSRRRDPIGHVLREWAHFRCGPENLSPNRQKAYIGNDYCPDVVNWHPIIRSEGAHSIPFLIALDIFR
jgi:hypothetical protein